MKKLFILFGLLVIMKWSVAQEQPLQIPENAVWQMVYLESMIELQYGTYAFRIDGEQSINDTLYHEVIQFN